MNAKAKKAMFALREELKVNPMSTEVTIQRDDLTAVISHLFFGNDEWSNQSALGYAIAAAKRSGMGTEDIEKLVFAMCREFDERTLDNAADVYRKSDY